MNPSNSDHQDDWGNPLLAGYSGKTLTQKLGIESETKLLVINQPENYFDLMPDFPFGIEVFTDANTKNVDLIHYFTKEYKDFKKDLPKLKTQILKNGAIWVSWPKKASKVATDMDESKIRDLALEVGLVDVKVCSVDEIWSGLKLVIPVKDREFKQFLDQI